MIRFRWLLLVGVALATLLPQWAAQAQGGIDVRLCDMNVDFPSLTFCIRVRGSAGRDILGIEPGQIHVIEDGSTLMPLTELREEQTDASAPARDLPLSDGRVEPLSATGATLAVVFDMPTVLRAERIGQARQATEQFLMQAGGLAPRNPEAISLYVPIARPDEQLQPPLTGADADGFTQDRNAVINQLRTMPPRIGKTTSLYAALQKAVEDVARVAGRRGSQAVVLVVSDGGDGISGETFNAIIGQANALDVAIVAFDYHAEGSFQLSQLANSTAGIYCRQPDDAAAGDSFTQAMKATPAGLYMLSYKTALRDDGKPHSIAIRVTLPGGTATSGVVEWQGGTAPSLDVFPPLRSVLLRQYLPLAVPATLLVSLLAALLTGAVRWSRGQVLIRDVTRR